MSKRRVVITGMGIVSPLGHDVDTVWANLKEGVSGVDSLTFDPGDLPTTFAAQVHGFKAEDHMDPKLVRRSDRFCHYAIASAGQAMKQARLTGDDGTGYDPARAGVIVGSGIGGIEEFTHNDLAFQEGGTRKVSPFFIPKLISNMASGYISIINNLKGPNYSISTACATSNHCFIEAGHMILRDDADIMLAGGTEASVTPLTLAGFCQNRAMSRRNDDPKRASRPYDTERDGFVLGEGSAVFVLEEREHALKRGATILAELMGGGMSADAFHITEPNLEGQELCLRATLRNAGLKPDDITYINAHGTSTPKGDILELQACKSVIGERMSEVKVNSTKSMTGHLLGAAGAIEAVACIKQLETQTLHPSINIENLDPEVPANVVQETQPFQFQYALSNSFGFGGHNASVIFGRGE